VEFEEDIELKPGLRLERHDNGSLIDIKYIMEENWSQKIQKNLCDPTDPDGATYLLEMANVIRNEYRDQPFVYQANKFAADLGFGSNAIRLPHVPHGLNDYSGYHRIW
jgi:hypothetical protein